MVDSNRKGGGFERQVCRDLSLWLSGGTRDDIFWRTSMSGGRATLGLAKGQTRTHQAGDVQPIAEMGMAFVRTFIIECKRPRALHFDRLITKGGGKAVAFWQKHRQECEQFDRLPFMVARQDNAPALLFMTEEGVQLCGYNFDFQYTGVLKAHLFIQVDLATETVVDDVYVFDWAKWRERVSPESWAVKASYEKKRKHL